jgi:hypothetical protein
MNQNPTTIIIRVKAGMVPDLERILDKINQDIPGNGLINFAGIISLHFCCWVVVQDDPNFPTSLVWEINHDGTTESHLDQVIANGRAGLEAIYQYCEGYTGAGLKEYLLAHSAPTVAFYVGCPGQSVGSIRNAIKLRQSIEEFVDKNQADFSGLNPLATHKRIKAFVINESKVKPEISPVTLDQQRQKAWLHLILFGLVAVPIILLLLPLILVYVVALRKHERDDAARPVPPPLPADPRLFKHEDAFVMNHLTTMVNVKPGAFRLRTLKFVLWLINLLAKIFFTTGNLGGIPTIHFARWILMENDRRLLFFSNYDGSWASYLGDFVDKANYGLTAVWSNTDGFPPSKFLFFGGALHIEAFKAWSRGNNLYAGIWYTAYPDETLWNLQKDVRIRDTILRDLTESEAAKLLQLL